MYRFISAKVNKEGLIVHIRPIDYIDYLTNLIRKHKNYDELKSKLTPLGISILEEYTKRLGDFDSKQILRVIGNEKALINRCIETILKRRKDVLNASVKDLNINLGMILALSDPNSVKIKDYIYAAYYEKFIHGVSTSFGILREDETLLIKKLPNYHIFPFKTDSNELTQMGSFDIFLIILDGNKVNRLIFIQMSSGPNCKNFNHAIQVHNVKDFFQNYCNNSLESLKDYVKKGQQKKHLKRFENLLDKLDSSDISPDKVEYIVGQAYGKAGMTVSMMKRPDVDVYYGQNFWDFITGINDSNPIKAEKIAGLITTNLYKEGEPSEAQKLNYWELLNKRFNELIKEIDQTEFSLD